MCFKFTCNHFITYVFQIYFNHYINEFHVLNLPATGTGQLHVFLTYLNHYKFICFQLTCGHFIASCVLHLFNHIINLCLQLIYKVISLKLTCEYFINWVTLSDTNSTFPCEFTTNKNPSKA
jgi:hypothetical protein